MRGIPRFRRYDERGAVRRIPTYRTANEDGARPHDNPAGVRAMKVTSRGGKS
jgi:hypothetical protein